MGTRRLLSRVRAGGPAHRRLELRGAGRRRARAERQLRNHGSPPRVHGVPDDVRDHHAGPDLRRRSGAHEVPGLRILHLTVEPDRVRAARPLGLGPTAAGSPESERWTSRAGPSYTSAPASRRLIAARCSWVRESRADEAGAGSDEPAQRAAGRARRLPPVVRLVRLQRRLGPRRRRARGRGGREHDARGAAAGRHLDGLETQWRGPASPLRGERHRRGRRPGGDHPGGRLRPRRCPAIAIGPCGTRPCPSSAMVRSSPTHASRRHARRVRVPRSGRRRRGAAHRAFSRPPRSTPAAPTACWPATPQLLLIQADHGVLRAAVLIGRRHGTAMILVVVRAPWSWSASVPRPRPRRSASTLTEHAETRLQSSSRCSRARPSAGCLPSSSSLKDGRHERKRTPRPPRQPGAICSSRALAASLADEQLPTDRCSRRRCPRGLLEREPGSRAEDPRLQDDAAALSPELEPAGGASSFETSSSQVVQPGLLLVERALQGGSWSIPRLRRLLRGCRTIFRRDRVEPTRGGEVADVHPPARPSRSRSIRRRFACTVDGQRLAHRRRRGDLSVSPVLRARPVTYCLALEEHGEDRRAPPRRLRAERAGSFNELIAQRAGLPHNPMINAGAIMSSCSLVRPSARRSPTVSTTCSTCGNATRRRASARASATRPTSPSAAPPTATSPWATSCARTGRSPRGPTSVETLEFYFQCCSLEVTTAELLGRRRHPGQRRRVCPLDRRARARTGDGAEVPLDDVLLRDVRLLRRVGVPHRSAGQERRQSGVILTVVPNVMGLCGLVAATGRQRQQRARHRVQPASSSTRSTSTTTTTSRACTGRRTLAVRDERTAPRSWPCTGRRARGTCPRFASWSRAECPVGPPTTTAGRLSISLRRKATCTSSSTSSTRGCRSVLAIVGVEPRSTTPGARDTKRRPSCWKATSRARSKRHDSLQHRSRPGRTSRSRRARVAPGGSAFRRSNSPSRRVDPRCPSRRRALVRVGLRALARSIQVALANPQLQRIGRRAELRHTRLPRDDHSLSRRLPSPPGGDRSGSTRPCRSTGPPGEGPDFHARHDLAVLLPRTAFQCGCAARLGRARSERTPGRVGIMTGRDYSGMGPSSDVPRSLGETICLTRIHAL